VANAPLNTVLRHIFRRAGAPPPEQASDADLLDRFVRRGEQDAFALLLHRHAGMVLHVGRRVLHHEQDAEDVFQATFLLLARKAAAIRKRASVASWLYGVAYHLALKARAQDQRRRAREQKAVDMPKPAAGCAAAWRELQEVLHDELHRLPAKYQAPLVLCYLEGKTHEEAARLLGWPLGTVRGRVARARDRLRDRLARRGLALSAALFGTVLAAGGAGAGVPARLLEPTLQSALHFAAGKAAPGLASARALALAEGGLKAMTASSWKVFTALLLTVTLATAGAGTLAHLAGAGRPPEGKRASAPPPPAEGGKKSGPDKGARSGRVDRRGDPLPAEAVARLGSARLWCGTTPVSLLAFSADSKTLATVNSAGEIVLWESPGGKEIRRLGSAGGVPDPNRVGLFPPVSLLTFAPDGKTFATLESPARVRVRAVATGKQVWEAEWPPANPAACCAFSPDGKILATPGPEHQVQLWDAATGNKLRTCRGHQGPVTALTFSPDGNTLLSGSDDLTVRVWQPATGKRLRSCRGHRDAVQALAVSPDGKTVASAGKDNTVRLWQAATGKEVRRWQVRGQWTVYHAWGIALQFAADGKSLFQASHGGLWVHATATGKEVRHVGLPEMNAAPVLLSPDGKTLAAALSSQRVGLWDAGSGQEVRVTDGHRTGVAALAFSPDGKTLASGGWDRTVCLWRPADGKQLRCLRGHTGAVNHLFFTADGKHLVSASNAANDRVISVWEAATGKEVRQLGGHRGAIVEAAFSPGGRLLAAVCRDGLLHVWQVATGKQLPAPRCAPYPLAFAPDGKALAFTDPTGQLRLWDVAAGKVLCTFKPRGQGGLYPYVLGFSGDGKTLFRSNWEMRLDAWDVATGKYLREVPGIPDRRDPSWIGKFGHAPLILSADGRTLALPGKDGTACLVELATGQLRRSFAGRQGGVTCLAFAPDGKSLASGSGDSTVLVWDLAAPAPGEKPVRGPLTAAVREALWADLGSTDGVKAYRAVRTLEAVPGQAVAFLKTKLPPVRPADARQVERLIADLDSKQFARRKKALHELEQLGEPALPLLTKALEGKYSLDVIQRLEGVVGKLKNRGLSAEGMREGRALEVLEALGTADARQVLTGLARGAAGARLTAEARACLERLKRRGG
jgi:RNA polymerase sigma factor (sigma-70 family)